MTPAENREEESVKINLRASRTLRDLIDQAAEATCQTRTQFMLNAAREAAENAIMEQRIFRVTGEKWDAFKAALDKPVPKADRVRKLLQTNPVWQEK